MANREFVLYRGEKFWLQSNGRYFQSGRKGSPERLLHRRIWIDSNGPIPKGHDVHHKDDDWRNNAISNLELLPKNKHRRMHMLRRNATPSGRQASLDALAKGRELAAAWHGSEEGKAWHSENAKRLWDNKKVLTSKCHSCGSKFECLLPTARFCSNNCEQHEAYKRHRNEIRICAYCHKEFMASPYRATACCSRICSNRNRRNHGKEI